jgi:pimeloyl-ACP methyl ester carboxylesterase
LVLLARACAAARFGVFRFDFSGTGESGGEHGAATLGQWVEEAAASLALLRQHTSLPTWHLLGVRLGANLALRAARAVPGITRLSLIEPVFSGADFLRDLQRRKQIKEMKAVGQASTSDQAMAAAWAAGKSVDLDGFEIGPALADELGRLELLADLGPTLPASAVQMIRVAGGKDFPPAWQKAVSLVRQDPDSEAILVRDKPFWGQIEYYESELVQREVLRFLASA